MTSHGTAVLFVLLCFIMALVECRHITTHQLDEEPIGASAGIPWGNFILGPIIFIFAFPCIWFNEKRAALDRVRLLTAEQNCTEIDP
jgi:hypothetical protein